jgi:tetratricopeptide (TPR) repeat protein
MQNLRLVLWPCLSLTLLLMGADWKSSVSTSNEHSGPVAIAGDVTLCGGASGTVAPGADGKFIKALPGWGNRHYPITTSSDSAQYYFDQGLGFYYGYHFTESYASFKEASRFDPSSAMTYWGQALARGPFYNTYVYRMPKDVPEIVAEMKRNAIRVRPKEADLIDAMNKRYSIDMTNADRSQLNRSYAAALEALISKYRDDSEIASLYVDAVMLEHKWDFWSNNGTPRAWTTSLVSLCEATLKRDKHPAMMHYYIHLVEASRTPGRALAVADELKEATAGIGHMVHMATHMYQRNGLYSQGVVVNEEANAVNNVTDTRVPSLKLGQDRATHFFAVQSFCAMTAGMYEHALPVYDRARSRMEALASDMRMETYSQFVYMMPALARVRLGKWQEIQSSTAPDSTWKYAYVLDQFGRGLAYVRGKNIDGARACLKHINAQLKDSLLAVRYMPFNSPVQSCRIASALLEGEILFADGKMAESFSAFRRAIGEEDQLIYREPHDWVVPARQFLGKYLLKYGQFKEAERVFREDLEHNPGNGWSLTGLSQALMKQNRTKDAELYAEQAKRAFASADVTVTESVL